MGRSYKNEDPDDRDRRRARKNLKNNHRNTDKAHLREFTSGNLSEEDYFEMEEDDYGKSGKPRH